MNELKKELLDIEKSFYENFTETVEALPDVIIQPFKRNITPDMIFLWFESHLTKAREEIPYFKRYTPEFLNMLLVNALRNLTKEQQVELVKSLDERTENQRFNEGIREAIEVCEDSLELAKSYPENKTEVGIKYLGKIDNCSTIISILQSKLSKEG